MLRTWRQHSWVMVYKSQEQPSVMSCKSWTPMSNDPWGAMDAFQERPTPQCLQQGILLYNWDGSNSYKKCGQVQTSGIQSVNWVCPCTGKKAALAHNQGILLYDEMMVSNNATFGGERWWHGNSPMVQVTYLLSIATSYLWTAQCESTFSTLKMTIASHRRCVLLLACCFARWRDFLRST
jgi:hypothetical protein